MKLNTLTFLTSVICLCLADSLDVVHGDRDDGSFLDSEKGNSSTSGFNPATAIDKTSVNSTNHAEKNVDNSLHLLLMHSPLAMANNSKGEKESTLKKLNGSSTNSTAKVEISPITFVFGFRDKILPQSNANVTNETDKENSSSSAHSYKATEHLSPYIEGVNEAHFNHSSSAVIINKSTETRKSVNNDSSREQEILTFDSGKAAEKDDESPQSAEDARKDRLLVAVVKTLVTTSITTSTTVVFATCRTTTPATACRRRRKRKQRINLRDVKYTEDLQSSLSTFSFPDTTIWNPPRRTGRFVIWSSSIQTVTFLSTSTNAATTVTASYACSFANIPALCG